jgi:glycolate oxidase
MLQTQIIEELTAIVGADNIATERQDLLCYSYDATQMEFLPDAVVHPANAEEVAAVLRLANRAGFPVFPRGAGSGFTGGSLPKAGGIVLVTTRMNRILRIDTENLIAEVEPGLVTELFQQEVEKLGLFYPPDPASLKFSTLAAMWLKTPAARGRSSTAAPRILSWGWRWCCRPALLSAPAVRPTKVWSVTI